MVTSGRPRIEGLDVIRGGAILLVLLRHAWPDTFGNAGIVGVVVFFTLSGYLITGVLLSDIRRFGRVRYGRFYRNRAIRLLPALILFLVVFVIVEGVFDLFGTRGLVFRSVATAITYTANVPVLNEGSPSVSHLWTLANEEQFYLIWPLVLALGVRTKKLMLLVGAVAALTMIGLAGTLALTMPDSVTAIYRLPTSWTIAMIVGAAAQIMRTRWTLLERGPGWMAAAAAAGLAFIAILPDAKDEPLMYLVGGAAIGVLSVAIIAYAKRVDVVARAWRPLLALGVISYAAYLWNYPIMWWLGEADVPATQPLSIALTIAAAAVSWFTVEKPLNVWKQRLDAKARARNLTAA